MSNVFQVFQTALATTPYPVTQPPAMGDAPVYLSFFEVLGRPDSFASNEARRVIHTMQVDIWGRQAIGPEFLVVAQALRAAGVRVSSWGPADYEQDTRWHHLPVTCYYTTTTEMEE
ncbi:MAG: hypothetical protein IKK21_06150 [Clostridia bacterium]|nr:hypothetical protein [Clostridia bacterium]